MVAKPVSIENTPKAIAPAMTMGSRGIRSAANPNGMESRSPTTRPSATMRRKSALSSPKESRMFGARRANVRWSAWSTALSPKRIDAAGTAAPPVTASSQPLGESRRRGLAGSLPFELASGDPPRAGFARS